MKVVGDAALNTNNGNKYNNLCETYVPTVPMWFNFCRA
jgi:hypothetical protein